MAALSQPVKYFALVGNLIVDLKNDYDTYYNPDATTIEKENAAANILAFGAHFIQITKEQLLPLATLGGIGTSIAQLATSVSAYSDNQTTENFDKIIQDTGGVIASVGSFLLMGAEFSENPELYLWGYGLQTLGNAITAADKNRTAIANSVWDAFASVQNLAGNWLGSVAFDFEQAISASANPTVTVNPDGSITTQYPDGSASTKVTNPDNSTTVSTATSNGSTSVIHYNADGSVADATVRTVNADGTYSIGTIDSNNTYTRTDYNGNDEVITTATANSNGSGNSSDNSNPNISISTDYLADGSSITSRYYPDGALWSREVSNADGTSDSSLYDPDGTLLQESVLNAAGQYSVTEYSNGATPDTRVINADGSGSYESAGTVGVFNADGSFTSTYYSADGTAYSLEKINADGSYSKDILYYNSNGTISYEYHQLNLSLDCCTYYLDGTLSSEIHVNSDGQGIFRSYDQSGTLQVETATADYWGLAEPPQVLADGSVWTTTYNANGLKSTETAVYPNGSKATYNYYLDGMRSSASYTAPPSAPGHFPGYANGSRFLFDYIAFIGGIAYGMDGDVSQKLGTVVAYIETYNPLQNLTSSTITFADGSSDAASYDTSGKVVSEAYTYADGSNTIVELIDNGQVLTNNYADGSYDTTNYYADHRVSSYATHYNDATIWQAISHTWMLNSAPVAVSDVFDVNADHSTSTVNSIDLLANDTDPKPGDTLSMIGFDAITAQGNAVTQDANGNLVLDIGNRYQYLAQGQTATDAFGYTIADAAGATSSATVTITINGVNDAPVVASDTAAVQEDTTLIATGNVLVNDSDVDQGTVLNVAGAGVIAGNYGSLTLNTDGSYSYTLDNASLAVQSLAAGQTVTDTFGYQATDGLIATQSSLTVTITGANDAPINVKPLSDTDININQALNYTIPSGAFTDIDTGDILTYTAKKADGTALPSWMTFNATTGNLSGTPTSANVGALDVLITATDNSGATVQDTLSITVKPAGITLTGTSGNDTLIGGSGDDVINGGSGADTMTGGLGNDTYYVDNAGDVVIENSGEGNDTVVTALASYTLGANVENLTLTRWAGSSSTGNALDNVITLAGEYYYSSSTLNGGAGADTMTGGAGNDTYYVDNVGDVVVEAAGGGTDTVISSVSYTLAANIENLTLTGPGLTGTGNALNNIYTISDASDVIVEAANGGTDTINSSVSYTLGANVENLTLTGSAAIDGTGNNLNNVITGNNAANILTGGLGNDTYYVDNAGDVVIENSGEGNDTVVTALASYTLGANVENLTLTRWAGSSSTGNALDNVITLAGEYYYSSSTLNGGAGADTMTGGAGNDTYYVDNVGDVVVESFAAGGGTDTVISTVSYTLVANVENLTLSGTNAINGTGNTLNNVLTGNSADNMISGEDGADNLTGGAGNDLLNGGTGNDLLNGGANNDVLEGADGNDTLSDTAGANLLDGGAGVDTMTGNTGNELFIGRTGNDTITTGTGADIIAFNYGDGQDTVVASTGADNTISLGGGIDYLSLTMSKSGNDLILATGNSDQITLQNWYSGTGNRSVANLQLVLDASTYNTSSSDPLLNQQVQDFDFAALAQAFDQALAGNPTLTAWSLTDSLLSAHLSGSDTAALGGDLAYQYNLNGTLAGIGLASAQTVINDTSFGVSAQQLHPLADLQTGTARLS
jgi:VCBS repeat-containing protein